MLPLLCTLVFVPTDVDGRPLPAGAMTRLGSARHSPGFLPSLVCPTPDSNRVLLVADRLMMWDVPAGRAVWTLSDLATSYGYLSMVTVPPGEVRAVAQVVPTDAAAWRELRAFDLRTGRLLRRERLDASCFRPATLSADGRTLARVDDKSLLTVSDADTGRTRWTYQLPNDLHVSTLAVAADVLAISAGGDVYFADAGTGPPVPAFQGQAHQLVLSDDGRTLVVVGRSRNGRPTTSAWDVRTRQLLWTRTPEPTVGNQGRPVFTPDGRAVLLSALDADGNPTTERVRVGDGVPDGPPVPTPLPAAIRPDGRLVTVAGGISVWDLDAGRRLGPGPDPVPLTGGRVRFADAGRRLVIDPGPGGGRLGWELATGRETDRMTHAEARRLGLARPNWADIWSSDVPRVAYSPDGRLRAAVVSPSNAPSVVTLTDPVTGVVTARLTVLNSRVSMVQFSPDGRHLLFGHPMDRYHLYDVQAGGKPREFAVFDCGRGCCGSDTMHWFDPTGRRLAVVTQNWSTSWTNNSLDQLGRFTVVVYDLPTLAEAARFSGPSNLVSFAWSADGRRVVGASGELLFVGEVPGGRMVTHRLTPNQFVNPTAMSANGRTLTALDYEVRGLRLIEAVTGQERLRLPGEFSAAGFGPADQLLAAVANDNTVLLYPLTTAPADTGPLEDDWIALGSPDAVVAFRAVRRLAADPARGVPLLRAKLPPVGVPHPYWTAAQMARLDAPRYADRRAAEEAFRRLGPRAKPALEAARLSPSPEVRSAVERLLAELASANPTAEDVQAVRAVEAVEWMDGPAATALLRAWAGGAADARLTREAADALTRRR